MVKFGEKFTWKDIYNFLCKYKYKCKYKCKYLNQRVRRIQEKNGKSFKGVSKTKKKKEIEFHNSIHFWNLFLSCWKNIRDLKTFKLYIVVCPSLKYKGDIFLKKAFLGDKLLGATLWWGFIYMGLMLRSCQEGGEFHKCIFQ